MADLAAKANEATREGSQVVVGLVASAVDKNSKDKLFEPLHSNTTVLNIPLEQTILYHAAGKSTLDSSSAKHLDGNSVFKLASCTKLITVLATLKLVEQGKLSLDDASVVSKHLPELCEQPVVTSAPGQPLTFEERKNPITIRQLLTHTSGSGYDFRDPQLLAWRKERGQGPLYFSGQLPEAIAAPFLFEPGDSWIYGAGLDWIGLLIPRVVGEPFGEWLQKEVFSVVGCDSNIGFNAKQIEDAGGVIVDVVTRTGTGALKEHAIPQMKSEIGGGGLYSSANNFVKIMADLIVPEPKILSPQSVDLLFSPQFGEGSAPLAALRSQSQSFAAMTGPLTASLPPSAVNHALGGLLITEGTLESTSLANTLSWGGAFGSLWFINRDHGVAAFYGGSIFPPNDPKSAELVGSFVTEVWKKIGAQ